MTNWCSCPGRVVSGESNKASLWADTSLGIKYQTFNMLSVGSTLRENRQSALIFLFNFPAQETLIGLLPRGICSRWWNSRPTLLWILEHSMEEPCIPVHIELKGNITKGNSDHYLIMLQHSWPAVMASTLRTSLSSIQSKLSQGDRHSIDRKAPCGNPSHNLLASRCTTALPLSVLITPIFLIFPAANATCIDWWFCRMLFFFF